MEQMDISILMLDLIHGEIKYFGKLKMKISIKDFSKIKPNSYVEEINAFIEKINNGQECSPSISDVIEVLKMVNFIQKNKLIISKKKQYFIMSHIS